MMMQRRELLTSVTSPFRDASVHNKEEVIRPPYNNEEVLFHQQCHNCAGECANVCEMEIIQISEDKTPHLSFAKSGCTFCDACANACEFGVLSLENRNDIKANIFLSTSSCLAWNATMCFSCKDPCLDNAIVFEGLFKPVIDMSKCTACGFCISRCPISAIEIKGVELSA